ncbi:MAG: bifunctional 4-hydroxy-2-oxoglutarate aldolase/2-dehydro-3-deoxy-phosphogluconate aldolase [Streptosporangiales bacterium]
MSRPAITPQLVESRLVAILRARDAEGFVETAGLLARSGVTCIEFTLTTRGAVEALGAAAGRLPAGTSLGAGTVLDADTAHAAIDAGAAFLVSPAVCTDVIEAGLARGVPTYPGAWTPTEVLTAWRAGAAAVKLFPASMGGPEYLQQLRAPLPDIPLIPTGGVTIESAVSYVRAGAIAVGVGSALTRRLNADDAEVVPHLVRDLADAATSDRQPAGASGDGRT